MILPKKISVVEVGPRDGFQNVKSFIPTSIKLELIQGLISSGVKEIEITSFVHPKVLPQMADASEVAQKIIAKKSEDLRVMALVPNKRGALNAQECGIRDVAYVISVSEKHNMANVNRTTRESLMDLKELITSLPDLSVRLDVATAFGCPFQGAISEQAVVGMVEEALASGVKEIVLCDTIGVANPCQVDSLIQKTMKVCGNTPLSLHLHDTMGMGLANTLAGIQAGVSRFETSLGGLGGCPFAPGAAGNTATEDMVNMLHKMEIATGINLDSYLNTVMLAKKSIDSGFTGHVSQVCRFS